MKILRSVRNWEHFLIRKFSKSKNGSCLKFRFFPNWFCFNFGKINFVKNRLPCLNMKITHRAFFEKIIIMRSKKKLKTECWNIGSRESGACLMKTLVPAFFAYELFFRKTNQRRWLQAKDAEHVRSSLCRTDFCWYKGTVLMRIQISRTIKTNRKNLIEKNLSANQIFFK